MLSVYLGKLEEAVYYPPVYFDNRYEDEWITDRRSVEIIMIQRRKPRPFARTSEG